MYNYIYETLHFIDPKKKDNSFAKDVLLYIQQNKQNLVDNEKLSSYRKLERGELPNVDYYKELIDPKNKKAKYFKAIYNTFAIDSHLINIIDAQLLKRPQDIVCKSPDEMRKFEKQKLNEKVLFRKSFTKIINGTLAEMGMPPITGDPYEYIDNLTGAKKQENLLSAIEKSLQNEEQVAIYNELLHKTALENAIETVIFNDLKKNRYDNILLKSIADLRMVNTVSLEYYTDEQNNTKRLKYLDPASVFTSKFTEEDGSDIVFKGYETIITFEEFLNRFGKGKSKEWIKQVFDLTRVQYNISKRYENCNSSEISQAKIRIGKIEYITQNVDIYERTTDCFGNEITKEQDFDYRAKNENSTFEKHTNVWMEFYYLSVSANTLNGTGIDAASLIFGHQPIPEVYNLQDFNYSKGNIIIYKYHNKLSFYDVKEQFMPQIRLLWYKYQNDLANAAPHGVIFDEQFINTLIQGMDSTNKDEKDVKQGMMAMILETGYGYGKLRGDNGQPIRPFEEFKTQHLSSAQEKLIQITTLYQQLTLSLGINDVREGIDPRPRTALGLTKIALQASNNATYYLEFASDALLVEIAYRSMYYSYYIITDGTSERKSILEDEIGEVNMMALESIKGIPLRRFNIYLEAQPTEAEKTQFIAMVTEMVRAGMIDASEGSFLTGLHSYKIGNAILSIKTKQKQAEQAQAEQQKQQVDIQMGDLIHKRELEIIAAKAKADMDKDAAIKPLEAEIIKIKEELKTYGALQVKDKIARNKIEIDENNHRHESNKAL